jgi:hypothetical protein
MGFVRLSRKWTRHASLGNHQGFTNILLGDGTVSWIPHDLKESSLNALITKQAREEENLY